MRHPIMRAAVALVALCVATLGAVQAFPPSLTLRPDLDVRLRSRTFTAASDGATSPEPWQRREARRAESGQARPAWPPPVRTTPDKAPTLSAEEEQKTLVLPPGYHAQLVAKEPMVVDPIAMDFDPDGRLWVLEMPGFMPDTTGRDSREPVNRVVVLEDVNGDIWRIVHDTTRRDRAPALSKASPLELVRTLSHPNGWWRDTAQRLIVERGVTSVIPQLIGGKEGAIGLMPPLAGALSDEQIAAVLTYVRRE